MKWGGELCVPDAGAPCPPGEACVKRGEAEFGGNCETQPIRATCGRNKRCSAAAGICVWYPSKGSGSCRSEPDTEAVERETALTFACTKPSDCAPTMQCCTDTSDGRGTFCQAACELANSTFLCDSDARCKNGMQEPVTKAKCVLASRDDAFKHMGYPPWVSVCHFE